MSCAFDTGFAGAALGRTGTCFVLGLAFAVLALTF